MKLKILFIWRLCSVTCHVVPNPSGGRTNLVSLSSISDPIYPANNTCFLRSSLPLHAGSDTTRAGTFIATLPYDALSLIVRYCSSAPQKPMAALHYSGHITNVGTSHPKFYANRDQEDDEPPYNLRHVSPPLRTATWIETSTSANAYHVAKHTKSLSRLHVDSEFRANSRFSRESTHRTAHHNYLVPICTNHIRALHSVLI